MTIELQFKGSVMKSFNKLIMSFGMILLMLSFMVSGAYALDTDEDGIDNTVDIDDDNDGILDSVEIQGAGNCPYGLFHMIYGVLNIYDVDNNVYVQIGKKHKNINAMGFDEVSGNLYGVIEDGSDGDDYGNALDDYEVVEIDRNSGKIKDISTSDVVMQSNSGDFFGGKLYGINTYIMFGDLLRELEHFIIQVVHAEF